MFGKEPALRTKRTRRRFAFWPVNMTDTKIPVWMDWYLEISEYRYPSDNWIVNGWLENPAWKVISRSLNQKGQV